MSNKRETLSLNKVKKQEEEEAVTETAAAEPTLEVEKPPRKSKEQVAVAPNPLMIDMNSNRVKKEDLPPVDQNLVVGFIEAKKTLDDYILKRDGYGNWKIANKSGAGLVHKSLRGSFTGQAQAKSAINAYLQKQ